MSRGQVSGSALLVIVGVWLLLQTIVGDLPGRLLSWQSHVAGGSGLTSSRDAEDIHNDPAFSDDVLRAIGGDPDSAYRYDESTHSLVPRNP